MRLPLLLISLLALPLTAAAQLKDSLVIEMKSGEIVKIPFDELSYITFETTADVAPKEREQPSTALSYPNPSERASTITFELAKPQEITIEIAGSRGELVRKIAKRCEAGPQEIVWDGLLQSGEPAPSGSYIYSFVADEKQLTGKLTIRR